MSDAMREIERDWAGKCERLRAERDSLRAERDEARESSRENIDTADRIRVQRDAAREECERLRKVLSQTVKHWDGYDEGEFADDDREGVRLLKRAAALAAPVEAHGDAPPRGEPACAKCGAGMEARVHLKCRSCGRVAPVAEDAQPRGDWTVALRKAQEAFAEPDDCPDCNDGILTRAFAEPHDIPCPTCNGTMKKPATYDDDKKGEVPLAASRTCWICGWDEPHTHTPRQINDAATKGPFCWECQGSGVIHTHPPTVGSCLPGCRKCVACSSTGHRPPRASAIYSLAAPGRDK